MEISGIFDAEFGVARMAARFPDRAAVICDGHPTLSFRELDRRANQMARVLAAHGLGKGDHVALLCCNRPEFAEVATAALQCGVVLSPVNWHLSPDYVAYVWTIAAPVPSSLKAASLMLPATRPGSVPGPSRCACRWGSPSRVSGITPPFWPASPARRWRHPSWAA